MQWHGLEVADATSQAPFVSLHDVPCYEQRAREPSQPLKQHWKAQQSSLFLVWECWGYRLRFGQTTIKSVKCIKAVFRGASLLCILFVGEWLRGDERHRVIDVCEGCPLIYKDSEGRVKGEPVLT